MRVRLNGTFGYGRPRVYYGPGVCEVPDGLARALGLAALPAPDEGAHEVGSLTDWFGAGLAGVLAQAGYTSIEAVRDASDNDLLAIEGVGPATLRRLRSA